MQGAVQMPFFMEGCACMRFCGKVCLCKMCPRTANVCVFQLVETRMKRILTIKVLALRFFLSAKTGLEIVSERGAGIALKDVC